MSELSKEILNRVVLPEVLHEQDPEKRPIFRPEAAAKAAKAGRTLMSVEESCVRNTHRFPSCLQRHDLRGTFILYCGFVACLHLALVRRKNWQVQRRTIATASGALHVDFVSAKLSQPSTASKRSQVAHLIWVCLKIVYP